MTKGSIHFVVDEPGWAFDRWTHAAAQGLLRHGVSTSRSFRASMPSTFDEEYVLVCWWPDVQRVSERTSRSQGILCRITDTLTWGHAAPVEWQQRFRNIVPSVSMFVASSKEIAMQLSGLGIKNSVVIGDCVDTTEFRPTLGSLGHKTTPSVGWCGNPTALEWMGFKDVKGLSTVQTLANCADVRLFLAADVPFALMPQWYRDVDIYVCASKSEGTPMPVLEAMASGIIVVSTPVGIVPEIASPGVYTFDGTPAGLCRALRHLIAERARWPALGASNREEVVEHWSTAAIAEKYYRHFFANGKGEPGGWAGA